MWLIGGKSYHRAALKLLPLLLGAPLYAGPFNYVTNGGFETGATDGVLTPDGGVIYVFGVGGATDIDGWTVSSSGIDNGSATPLSVLVTGNPPQPPAGGSYAVDFDPYWNIATGALLDGSVTGTLPQISQTFSLPAGDYALSFDGALETPTPPNSTRPLTVTLTGAATLDETVTADQDDSTGYTLYTFDFDSTGGDVTLTFTPDDFSPEPNFMLDNVSVVSTDISATVPEPSFTLPALGLLLGLVLAAKSAGSRPRRRQ